MVAQNFKTDRMTEAKGLAACGLSHAGGTEPITILLVDDDPDCRMLIRDAIEESKVSNRVYEVANGREALDFLTRRGQVRRRPAAGADLPGHRDARA